MRKHAESNRLRRAMARVVRSAVAWSGVFYRATGIRYANRLDLLQGSGARLHGGRWTPPGEFHAVYGSLSPETAMAESLVRHREYGLPIAQAMPLVIVAVAGKLQAMLDLEARPVQRLLAIDMPSLVGERWRGIQDSGCESLAQAIGRTAWELRFEGLLVPSACAQGGMNIVIFPRRRRKGSSLRIQQVRDLPKVPPRC